MNRARRKQIALAEALLLQAAPMISQALDLIEIAAVEEREFYDNMPTAMQEGSARGAQASDATDALDEVYGALAELDIEGLASRLSEASS